MKLGSKTIDPKNEKELRKLFGVNETITLEKLLETIFAGFEQLDKDLRTNTKRRKNTLTKP